MSWSPAKREDLKYYTHSVRTSGKPAFGLDWSTSVLLPMHKKGPVTICDNYRLIALISHASKIKLYIIQAMLHKFLAHQIPQNKLPKLWATLEELEVSRHLINLVKNLYEDSQAIVKIFNTLSEPCHIRKGIPQECVLSPLLYNVYSEMVMRCALENWRSKNR